MITGATSTIRLAGFFRRSSTSLRHMQKTRHSTMMIPFMSAPGRVLGKRGSRAFPQVKRPAESWRGENMLSQPLAGRAQRPEEKKHGIQRQHAAVARRQRQIVAGQQQGLEKFHIIG